MVIDELSSKQSNKYVTITLSYEECRDISNGLYLIQKTEDKYRDTYHKMKMVFDLIKEGNILPGTICKMYNSLTLKISESGKEGENK
jgi:hypothetical protein